MYYLCNKVKSILRSEFKFFQIEQNYHKIFTTGIPVLYFSNFIFSWIYGRTDRMTDWLTDRPPRSHSPLDEKNVHAPHAKLPRDAQKYIRIYFVNASHSKPFVHTLLSTYSSVVSMLVVDVTSLCHALHISVEHKHVWYVHINSFHDIIGILWYTFS